MEASKFVSDWLWGSENRTSERIPRGIERDMVSMLKDFSDTVRDEHAALQAKHDELAELVLQYFQAKANLEMLTNAHRAKNNAKSFQAKLNATHGMVKAEAALRKAVDEG
jgi:hypothetical protein